MKKVLAVCLILFVSGCATTARQLRENPAGVYSFKVSADYKTVYEKALLHARSCYELAATGNTFVVQGDAFPGTRKASISIARLRAIARDTVMTIDTSQLDDTNTEVNVYYEQSRYKTAAMTVEEWIKQDSNECNRGKVVVECVCYLGEPR